MHASVCRALLFSSFRFFFFAAGLFGSCSCSCSCLLFFICCCSGFVTCFAFLHILDHFGCSFLAVVLSSACLLLLLFLVFVLCVWLLCVFLPIFRTDMFQDAEWARIALGLSSSPSQAYSNGSIAKVIAEVTAESGLSKRQVRTRRRDASRRLRMLVLV